MIYIYIKVLLNDIKTHVYLFVHEMFYTNTLILKLLFAQ